MDLTRADDVELLRAAAKGDEEAAAEIVDAHLPVVWGYILPRVGGDEAVGEDILQETLLEALKGAKGFRGDAALSTWMCTIARRRVARHFEKERRQETARRGLRIVPHPGPPESDDEVIRALGGLPVVHRQVLVMKYLDEMTVEEIAKVIGRTRVQVQSLLQRARDGLKKGLASAG